MPTYPTAVNATTRYFAAGVTKVYFLPSIASGLFVPTRAEITAGKDLTPEVADWSGWTVQSNTIDTPDLATTFTGQINGRTSAPGSSITFHGDKAGNDVRKVLPRNTVGFILIADGGDVPAQPADVFPVLVTSVGKLRSTSDTNFRFTTNFSITRQPAEDIALPANA